MTFVANPAFSAEMKQDKEFQVGLGLESEPTRELAQHYAHHIYPVKGARIIEITHDEDDVYIVNTSHGGHIDEWGSVDQPPNAPLRRACDATGLRLVESPKP